MFSYTFLVFIYFLYFWLVFFRTCRDEVLTKNKFLEEEAKRKAEAVENGEESESLQQDAPTNESNIDDSQEDDILYDSEADQREK